MGRPKGGTRIAGGMERAAGRARRKSQIQAVGERGCHVGIEDETGTARRGGEQRAGRFAAAPPDDRSEAIGAVFGGVGWGRGQQQKRNGAEPSCGGSAAGAGEQRSSARRRRRGARRRRRGGKAGRSGRRGPARRTRSRSIRPWRRLHRSRSSSAETSVRTPKGAAGRRGGRGASWGDRPVRRRPSRRPRRAVGPGRVGVAQGRGRERTTVKQRPSVPSGTGWSREGLAACRARNRAAGVPGGRQAGQRRGIRCRGWPAGRRSFRGRRLAAADAVDRAARQTIHPEPPSAIKRARDGSSGAADRSLAGPARAARRRPAEDRPVPLRRRTPAKAPRKDDVRSRKPIVNEK